MGSARAAPARGNRRVRRRVAGGTTAVYGTPLAMAPEQLTGGAVSPAMDIYALGALLYRLVCGHHPVEADRLEELRARHARDGPVPLSDRRPDVPAEFARVI